MCGGAPPRPHFLTVNRRSVSECLPSALSNDGLWDVSTPAPPRIIMNNMASWRCVLFARQKPHASREQLSHGDSCSRRIPDQGNFPSPETS